MRKMICVEGPISHRSWNHCTTTVALAEEVEERGVFCDGFKIATGPYEGSLELQRFLNDHDIHSKLPHNHPSKGFMFVQLAS